MKSAQRVFISIECPDCRQATQETVARLIPVNNLPCSHCGSIINLEVGNVAFLIQKLGKQCADFDALASERN